LPVDDKSHSLTVAMRTRGFEGYGIDPYPCRGGI
jgi:hypothetical protein